MAMAMDADGVRLRALRGDSVAANDPASRVGVTGSIRTWKKHSSTADPSLS
jgi:hypothetical protein